jgi:hypothetical protein
VPLSNPPSSKKCWDCIDKKQDYAAAAERYRQALAALSDTFSWKGASASALVLVEVQSNLRIASVIATREAKGTVLVDLLNNEGRAVEARDSEAAASDGDDEDEILALSEKDIRASICPVEHRRLQCALFLNLARSEVALRHPSEDRDECNSDESTSRGTDSSRTTRRSRAMWHCTSALRIASCQLNDGESSYENRLWSKSTRCTAHFLRAKVHLSRHLEGDASSRSILKARKDALQADDLDTECVALQQQSSSSSNSPKKRREITVLLKEIDRAEKKVLKADRQLARRIGEWTELAVARQAEVQQSNCEGGDD